jgi:hypothetical protein
MGGCEIEPGQAGYRTYQQHYVRVSGIACGLSDGVLMGWAYVADSLAHRAGPGKAHAGAGRPGERNRARP